MIPAPLLQGKLHLLSSVNVVTDGASSSLSLSLPSAHFLSHFLSSRHLPLNLPPPPLSILSSHIALWLHLRSQPPACSQLSALFSPPVLLYCARTHTHICMHAHTFTLSFSLSVCLSHIGPVQTWGSPGEEMMPVVILLELFWWFFPGFFSPFKQTEN